MFKRKPKPAPAATTEAATANLIAATAALLNTAR